METVDDLCMGCMSGPRRGSQCPDCGYVEGTRPANPLHLRPRTRLRDQYLLGRVLGHGGFGIVYLAWQLVLETKLAVKEFLPGDHATRSADGTSVTPYTGQSNEHFEYGLRQFLAEARALARFNDHPGIVPVQDFFRENGTGYLVMRYIPGMTFKEDLALKGGQISWDETLSIAMPVMDTLRAVHEGDLLHRDISPDNIYISRTRQVKLLDFGAARQALGDRSKSLSVILKAGYAPFEQYQTRGRQGAWTDVYALAATMYRALTGESPPESPERITNDEIVPPRSRGVSLPAVSEAVLMRALAVDARARYQSMAEFQEALWRSASEVKGRIVGPGQAEGFERRRGVPVEPPEPRDHDRATPPQPKAAEPTTKPLRGLDTTHGNDKTSGSVVTIALDTLDRVAAMTVTLVRRLTSLEPAPGGAAAARQAGLIVAALAGGLGVLWSFGILRFLLAALAAGSNAAVLLSLFRVAFGGLCAGIMALGGVRGLAQQPAGVPLVWAAGWWILVAGVVGSALQILTYIPLVPVSMLSPFITNEISTLFQALLPTVVVLLLLWVRPTGRTPASAEPPPS